MQTRPITRLLATSFMAVYLLTGCVNKSNVDVSVPEEVGPKWGFINHSGEFVIKPQFRRVKRFTEGLAGADLHARWGFIDRTGKFVIERSFEDVQVFSAGYAGVQQGGSWYVINKKGRVLWPGKATASELGFAHEVDPDAEDHAVLVPYKDIESKKWGFHDFGPHGKGDIAPKFDDVKYFNDGLCPVFNRKKSKWGFINNTGVLVIDYKFDGASAFKNRIAECMMGDDFVWVDKIGTIAVKNRLESNTIFHDGLALQQRKGRFIFINRSGDPAFKKRFRYGDNFSEGLAVVQPMKTGKRGFIDQYGELVMPAIFDDARGFSETLAAVKVDPDRFFKEYGEDFMKAKGETKAAPKTGEGTDAEGKHEGDGEHKDKSTDEATTEGKHEGGESAEGKGESKSNDDESHKSDEESEKSSKSSDGESKSKSSKSSSSSAEGEKKSSKSADEASEKKSSSASDEDASPKKKKVVVDDE